jgi:putative membrane protein
VKLNLETERQGFMAVKKNSPVATEKDPRTYWALERTFLAWLRTGLALMGFGFVVARFGLFLRMLEAKGAGETAGPGNGWSMVFGTALVLLGALVQAGALAAYLRGTAQLEKGQTPEAKPSFLAVGSALVLITIAVVMAFYLILKG